jgi:membrane-associated phospholipid phosphatase
MGGAFDFGRATAHPLPADIFAIIAVAGMGLLTVSWNAVAGLRFSGNLLLVSAIAGGLAAIGLWYLRFRPGQRRLGELALYIGLWIAWSLSASILTYLTNRWRFPMRDEFFYSLDRAIGFDWANLMAAHAKMPGLLTIERIAYHSYYPQAIFSISFLALFGKLGVNGRLLMAMTMAIAITAIVSGLMPSLGPSDPGLFISPWGPIVKELRYGSLGPYLFIGIVNFPSFHAVMAVFYTIIHSDSRLRFGALAALNTLMLLSTLFVGRHYLMDVLAGVLIALICWWLAGKLVAQSLKLFSPGPAAMTNPIYTRV